VEFHKPLARALKYGFLKRLAERRASRISGANDGLAQQAMAFIIGCGRSGTTVLGEVLEKHPSILYFFEPYHLWATVDPITDVTNLYSQSPAKFILDANDCTHDAQRRFNLLFMERAHRAGSPLIVEKTPFNAARIGYLESLKPESKFVHIIRDGVDVARSIARLSEDNSYQIAGKPDRSRWWGHNDSKWTAIARDGKRMKYFAGEVDQLSDFAAKGAYEWLVSLAEVDSWRKRLGNRLMEITYDRLTTDPRGTIADICDFLSVPKSDAWLDLAIQKIDGTRHNPGSQVLLPPAMCEEFNRRQIRWGFAGRAISSDTSTQSPHAGILAATPILNSRMRLQA